MPEYGFPVTEFSQIMVLYEKTRVTGNPYSGMFLEVCIDKVDIALITIAQEKVMKIIVDGFYVFSWILCQ